MLITRSQTRGHEYGGFDTDAHLETAPRPTTPPTLETEINDWVTTNRGTNYHLTQVHSTAQARHTITTATDLGNTPFAAAYEIDDTHIVITDRNGAFQLARWADHTGRHFERIDTAGHPTPHVINNEFLDNGHGHLIPWTRATGPANGCPEPTPGTSRANTSNMVAPIRIGEARWTEDYATSEVA